MADNSNAEGVLLVRALIPEGCRLFVYDKGRSYNSSNSTARCQLPPLVNTECKALPNIGREFGSFVHHVQRHYEALPDWLLFVPSSLHKHQRGMQLQRMLQATVLRGTERRRVEPTDKGARSHSNATAAADPLSKFAKPASQLLAQLPPASAISRMASLSSSSVPSSFLRSSSYGSDASAPWMPGWLSDVRDQRLELEDDGLDARLHLSLVHRGGLISA